MTKQQKVDKIYEIIADKEWRFGCEVEYINQYGSTLPYKVIYAQPHFASGSAYFNNGEVEYPPFCTSDIKEGKIILTFGNSFISVEGNDVDQFAKESKTIGNPVTLGHVINWIEKNKDTLPMYSPLSMDLLMAYWKRKDWPIEAYENNDAMGYVFSDFICNFIKNDNKA